MEPGAEAAEKLTMEQLLKDEPLHSRKYVQSLWAQPQHGKLYLPSEIRAHCSHEKCGGIRRYVPKGD